MSDYEIPTGKRRTAHLPAHHIDLRQKLNHLKTMWKPKEHSSPNIQQPQNSLTPMRNKAKELIIKQQQTSITTNHHSNKPKRPTITTNREKFLERRAAKHPETITQHAPPMTFYYANRSFESRQAYLTEDRQRLEGCHQLLLKQEQQIFFKRTNNVKK